MLYHGACVRALFELGARGKLWTIWGDFDSAKENDNAYMLEHEMEFKTWLDDEDMVWLAGGEAEAADWLSLHAWLRERGM